MTEVKQFQIIMDTNIVSTFGKIGRFDLLMALFPNSILFISSSVEDELNRAEKELEFTKKIVKKIKTISSTNAERKLTEILLSKRSMGKAEAECMAIAKSRNMLLLTNDKIAVKEARKAGADLMDLRAIIRELWKQNVLSKEAAESLILNAPKTAAFRRHVLRAHSGSHLPTNPRL